MTFHIPDPEPLREELIENHPFGYKLRIFPDLNSESEDPMILFRRWHGILCLLCPKEWALLCAFPLEGEAELFTPDPRLVVKHTGGFQAFESESGVEDLDFESEYLYLKLVNRKDLSEKGLFYAWDVAEYYTPRIMFPGNWENIARAVLIV